MPLLPLGIEVYSSNFLGLRASGGFGYAYLVAGNHVGPAKSRTDFSRDGKRPFAVSLRLWAGVG